MPKPVNDPPGVASPENPDLLEQDIDPGAPVVPETTSAQEIDLDEEEVVEEEFKTLDNKAFAALRKRAKDAERALVEKEARISELEKRPNPVAPAPSYPPPYSPADRQRRYIGGVAVPATDEEWDTLARSNWKLAVDIRSILRAEELQSETREIERGAAILEEAKSEVLSRHPELDDETSEKSQIFSGILQRNPRLAKLPEGPIIVMHKMEKAMRDKGMTDDMIFGKKEKVAVPSAELSRTGRAALTAGGRMPEKKARTVTLSSEDLEFCKNNDIDPKDFARERLEQENRRKGVQL